MLMTISHGSAVPLSSLRRSRSPSTSPSINVTTIPSILSLHSKRRPRSGVHPSQGAVPVSGDDSKFPSGIALYLFGVVTLSAINVDSQFPSSRQLVLLDCEDTCLQSTSQPRQAIEQCPQALTSLLEISIMPIHCFSGVSIDIL